MIVGTRRWNCIVQGRLFWQLQPRLLGCQQRNPDRNPPEPLRQENAIRKPQGLLNAHRRRTEKCKIDLQFPPGEELRFERECPTAYKVVPPRPPFLPRVGSACSRGPPENCA